jgi:hypothetical protein
MQGFARGQGRRLKLAAVIAALGIVAVPLGYKWVEALIRETHLWVEDDRRDQSYAMDVAALSFLPADCRAKRIEKTYWCGTPLVMHEDTVVSEAALVNRAQRMLNKFAPEESVLGAHIIRQSCRTSDCKGMVRLGDYFSTGLGVSAFEEPEMPEEGDVHHERMRL